MSLWNKSKKAESPAPLPKWAQAKQISSVEAFRCDLPLGWYIYPENNHWIGMKPNEAQSGHLHSQAHEDPKELESWLEIPVPEIVPPPKPPIEPKLSLDERIRQELIEKDPTNSMKPDPLRKRCHRLYVRMDDREYEDLKAALEATGMGQQTYILQAIRSYETSDLQEQMLQQIHGIGLDLSCEIQLLRSVLKQFPQQRLGSPEAWEQILEVIKDRENMKQKLRKLMEASHGHR